MFAVVAPKNAGLTKTRNATGKLWDLESKVAIPADGDYIDDASGSHKINPGSIDKFGLVPIARLGPRMSKELLAERAAMTAKPQAPKMPAEKLRQWVSEQTQNEPSLTNLKGLSYEQKIERFNDVATRLRDAANAPPDATYRLLMMSLKSLHLSATEIASERGVPGDRASAR
jgi:hypothetical protein